MSIHNQINDLVNIVKALKKPNGKPVDYRQGVGDYVSQVIIENSFHNKYHTLPPIGVPDVVYPTVEEAMLAALQEAVDAYPIKD